MKAQLMYAAAIIVVLIGAGTLYYGATNPVVTQSSTITPTTNVLVPGVNRTVDAGGVWGIGGSSFQFNKGDQISGTAQVSNMDPSKGNLFFYVMDTPQWVAFGQGKPCNLCATQNYVNQTVGSDGKMSFTWTVPASGAYYFVLDASTYNADPNTTFNANITTMTTNMVNQYAPNTTADYAGVAIMILGALIFAAAGIKSAPEPEDD